MSTHMLKVKQGGRQDPKIKIPAEHVDGSTVAAFLYADDLVQSAIDNSIDWGSFTATLDNFSGWSKSSAPQIQEFRDYAGVKFLEHLKAQYDAEQLLKASIGDEPSDDQNNKNIKGEQNNES